MLSKVKFWDGKAFARTLVVLFIFIFSLSFFGMIPVAYAADYFGRRKTIQIGAAIYM